MEHPLLKPYKSVLKRLTLFILKYDKQPNTANRLLILNTFEAIKGFDTSIRLNADDVDMAMAYKLKRKMITYFDQCISAFVSQRDFTKEIESVKGKLTETITIEEVTLLQSTTVQPQEKKRQKHDYHEYIWFKVGILFATGEMDKLLTKFNHNATQIAKHIDKDEWKGYRPYISESMNNTTKSNKNIYSSRDKLKKIIDHCRTNNIDILPTFIKHLPSE